MKPTIRRAGFGDCQYVVSNLRAEDQRELESIHPGENLINLLWDGCVQSYQAFAMCFTGYPVALFGIRDVPGTGTGVPWMVCTHGIGHFRFEVLREMRHWVASWTWRYRRLQNYVDPRNALHVRWLKLLGFKFEEPVFFTVQQRYTGAYADDGEALMTPPETVQLLPFYY